MRNLAYTFTLVIFCLLVSANLFAQEEMTLEKAIALGLKSSFSIQIDEQAIRIAENNAGWSMAGRAPTIDLRGYANNNLTKDNNPASFLQGTFYNGSFGGALDINWLVYAGGRVGIAKDQLDLALGQQRLNQETGIQDLIREIYTRYYEVLLQQDRLDVLRESLDLSLSRFSYEQSRKEFGSSNSYNLTQFESGVIADSNNVLSQVIQLDVAKRNLYNVLQIKGEASYTFPEELATTVEEIDGDKLKASLTENNYTLKSLTLLSELDALNSKMERAARRPSVSISGSGGAAENAFKIFGENPISNELLWSTRYTGSLNASVNWNLYNGGIQNTAVENALIQEEISRLTQREAEVELANQLDILIANYQSQKSLLQLADEQVSIARRNLDMTEERFKSGTLTSLDFRTIQNQYLTAAFNKVSAIYNLILTKTEIDYLVGKFAKPS